MIIRKAKTEDSNAIARLFMLAMDEIVFHFIGDNSVEKATLFLENMIGKKTNQYSYENCWVADIEDKIVAVANIYAGSELQKLRAPVAEEIKLMFKKNFNPEDETQNGELYIDCLGVCPNWQRKGIGSKMLKFLINEYADKTIGLLVDKDNPNAKKLYLKIGFEKVGEMILAGKEMEHLQINVKTSADNSVINV